MGHQSKEHQAELAHSEVLEMEANSTRYLSKNVAAEPSSISGGRRLQSLLERARRDDFREMTLEP